MILDLVGVSAADSWWWWWWLVVDDVWVKEYSVCSEVKLGKVHNPVIGSGAPVGNSFF